MRYQLNTVQGVAEVASIGGLVREYQIDLDPKQAVCLQHQGGQGHGGGQGASNKDSGGKLIEQADAEYLIRGRGYVKSREDLENIVVSADMRGTPIYLKNLGTVQMGGAILDGKNILVIHSYHQTYMFTDQEMNGILRVLRKNDPNYMPYVEYLDWKRFPDENRISMIKETLRNKYSGIIFDAVIATDNKALEFALKYRSQLFSKAAISFCGVNGYKDSMIQGHDRVSGVAEDVDPVGTVDLITTMLPETREIVVLVDDSESSNEVLEEIGKALVDRKNLSIRVLKSPDQNELITAVSGLKKGSVLLQGNFSRDHTGRTFEFEEVLAHIMPHTNVPIFSLWDFLEGKGITGGSLLSGEMQGENAARIALQFLNGEKSVPVITKGPTKVLLDYRQLKRFNLENRPIPSGIKVINQPVSFVEAHFKIIVAVILTIFVLLVIIVALVAAIRKKDQAEKSLRESEDRYRTIFDSSNNAVFIHRCGYRRYFGC